MKNALAILIGKFSRNALSKAMLLYPKVTKIVKKVTKIKGNKKKKKKKKRKKKKKKKKKGNNKKTKKKNKR